MFELTREQFSLGVLVLSCCLLIVALLIGKLNDWILSWSLFKVRCAQRRMVLAYRRGIVPCTCGKCEP